MRRILISVAVLLGVSLIGRANAPKVVKASPDDGQAGVDSMTRELRVIFDQPMDTSGNWSVVGGGDAFPKFIGKPRWIDEKTFVWQMKLQAEHEYWLSINSDRFTNFKSKSGESAEPYPISFTTASGKGTTRPAKEDNQRAIDVLKQAIDEDYSYRDRLKIDWKKRFAEFEPKLLAATSPDNFARTTADLLSAAKDVHIWIKVGDKTIGTHRTGTTPNFNLKVLAKIVPNWTEHEGGVAVGKFDDGIVYVLIPGWSDPQRQGMEAVYAELSSAKKIIVDVRPNGGGDEPMARDFAGCFVDAPKIYSKDKHRHNGEFSKVYDRLVEPNKARPHFAGPVVVLMGPKNVSSCESFILMMKQIPGCKLIGDKSYGSSGNPKPADLGNGVTVFLPSWVDMLPDGSELEGVGISPDISVKTSLADLAKRDAVLEEGLKQLRK